MSWSASNLPPSGLAQRLLKCFDKALGYHTQELTIRQEMADVKGECKAHGHLGAVHMSLAYYTNAMKCYQEQLERANELKVRMVKAIVNDMEIFLVDLSYSIISLQVLQILILLYDAGMEAQAFGNLGIARQNMGYYKDAIGYLEQQLATLEQLSTTTALVDTGRAFGNLGDCYDALGDSEEVIKCHEQVNHFAVFHGVELAFLTFCSMYAMIKVLTFPPFRSVPIHLTEDEEPSGPVARVPRPGQLTPRSGQPGAGAGLLREAPRRRPPAQHARG